MTTNTVCVDDYIAPGATDDSSAFTSAFATGKIVTMTARTYTVSGFSVPSNSILEGVGAASKIVAASSTTTPVISVSNASHVMLRDFQLTSGSGDTGSTLSISGSYDVTVSGVSISSVSSVSSGAAISISNGTDQSNGTQTRILNCAISGNGVTNCVTINASSSIAITDCFLTGANSWAIYVSGSSSSPNDELLIARNYMSGAAGGVYLVSDLSPSPWNAINPTAPQSKGVRIVGNHIENMGLFGLLVASWGAVITDNILRNISGGITSTNLSGSAIVAQCQQVNICNNSIFNASGDGIDCGGSLQMSVSGNIIQQVGLYGIEMSSSQYTVCSGNVIIGALQSTNTSLAGRGGTTQTAGIMVSEDPGVKNGGTIWGFNNGNAQPTITCSIYGNVIGQCPTPSYQQYGILLRDSGSAELYYAVYGNSLPGAGSVSDISNNGTGNVLTGNVTTH